MDPRPVVDWYRENARELPWRRPGFPAWGTLVSEFMLQQTPVVRVVPVLAEWLERWPRPSDLAAAPVADVLRAWGRLGYPRRALALQRCAAEIAEHHGDRVPEDVDALLALPGIGDYTARAILVFAFRKRHPVVDTNIRRVIARADDGLANPPAPSARRDLPRMTALLPEYEGDAHDFTAGIMELGALVCTARAPRCDACPLEAVCAWRAAGSPAGPPGRRPQARFEGSDRQRRGLVMAALREHGAVDSDHLARLLPDAAVRDRIVDGLAADRLAERTADGVRLPA